MDIFIPIAQALINGILQGGVYAAYAAGFSLIFGVMGVMNISHGELVMLGAFLTYWLFTLYNLDPFLSIPIAIISLFLLGYLLQSFVINRVVEAKPLVSLILTFGISLIIAHAALLTWTADVRMVTTSYSGSNFIFGGLVVPYARLITFALALMAVAFLYILLNYTDMGRAIRATAQDKEVARLMGVNIRRVYALTFALGSAITGMAGALITAYYPIYPQMGGIFTLFAFCVVVLGGMGYILGALIGGLTLGVAQALTTSFLGAGLSLAVTFLLLYFMLVLRPKGIMGKGIVE